MYNFHKIKRDILIINFTLKVGDYMDFIETIKFILKDGTMNIPNITDIICEQYPSFSQRGRSVVRNRIRNLIKSNDNFIFYETTPRSGSLNIEYQDTTLLEESEIHEDYEKEKGTIYILQTNTLDKETKLEIFKIGFTTQKLKNRINQLYTTGTPYKFEVFKSYEVKNYIELEKSLHKLLKPFQLNNSREFFTQKALKYIDEIVNLHNRILSDD